MVKLTDVKEWDEQDQEVDEMSNQGYFRNSSEGKPSYHILNEKEMEELEEQCIPDDPDHYTRIEIMGKWERPDLEGFLCSLLPKED